MSDKSTNVGFKGIISTVNKDTVYTLTATNAAGRATSSVRILLPRQSTPVISEVKAYNTTRKDQDGEYSDWLEIHNPGSTTIDLDGWFLTDNEARRDKWRLPRRNLRPGDHLLVYCSGKNKSPSGNGELHTNFRLSTDGNVKLLDFGVARDLKDDKPEEGGWVLGDPLYMPPEQTKPNLELDHRADIDRLSLVHNDRHHCAIVKGLHFHCCLVGLDIGDHIA